jgi:hypothetical protein
MKIMGIFGIIIVVMGLIVETNPAQSETFYEFLERMKRLPTKDAKTQDGLYLRRSLKVVSDLIEDTDMMMYYTDQVGKKNYNTPRQIIDLVDKLEARNRGESTDPITFMGISLPTDMTPANWNWVAIALYTWLVTADPEGRAMIGISHDESYVSEYQAIQTRLSPCWFIPECIRHVVAADIGIYIFKLGLREYLQEALEAQAREHRRDTDRTKGALFEESITAVNPHSLAWSGTLSSHEGDSQSRDTDSPIPDRVQKTSPLSDPNPRRKGLTIVTPKQFAKYPTELEEQIADAAREGSLILAGDPVTDPSAEIASLVHLLNQCPKTGQEPINILPWARDTIDRPWRPTGHVCFSNCKMKYREGTRKDTIRFPDPTVAAIASQPTDPGSETPFQQVRVLRGHAPWAQQSVEVNDTLGTDPRGLWQVANRLIQLRVSTQALHDSTTLIVVSPPQNATGKCGNISEAIHIPSCGRLSLNHGLLIRTLRRPSQKHPRSASYSLTQGLNQRIPRNTSRW